jgi:tRNA (cmo5U34)-methyltransferase
MDGTWMFDSAIAETFDIHAQRHIPDYMATLDDAVALAHRVCQPNDPIVEIGCAIGETLQRLHEAGFKNLTGVDNSSAMLGQCNPQLGTLVLSDTFPAQHAPFQLVLANWTLHFIEPSVRALYIASIYDGLIDGGYLMLTEKCVQSDAMRDVYHAWKRGMGVSQAEIDSKAKALDGVLFPMPVMWVVSTLESVGFSVDVWRASCGFVTFLAQKRFDRF